MVIAVSGNFNTDAAKFICYKVEKDSVRERECIFTPPGGKGPLIRQFIGLEIDLLITENISAELEESLIDAGISVIKGISGIEDQILKEYLNGTLNF